MRTKKGAVELSINMLVIIILSLVILGGGIALLFQFVNKAETVKGELDAQTREELERLLVDEGQQVALPRHRATVQRGKSHIFGVGVLNTKPGPDEFTVSVEINSWVNPQNQVTEITDDLTTETYQRWLLYSPDSFPLQQGEHTTQNILVTVPKDALEGTYIFNVRIYAGDDPSSRIQYGNTQKLYVTAT